MNSYRICIFESWINKNDGRDDKNKIMHNGTQIVELQELESICMHTVLKRHKLNFFVKVAPKIRMIPSGIV